MKPHPFLAILAAATAASLAGSIRSEIAGFTVIDIPGAATETEPQLSTASVGLLKPSEYIGVAEAAVGLRLLDAEANWTVDQFNPPRATAATATYYVQFASGPLAGATFDIVRTAKTSLRLAQPITANAAKARFHIRRHRTISDLFGANNEIGLGTGNADTADEISIFNGGTYEKFYFNNGWRKVGAGDTDQASFQVRPGVGITIRRLQPGMRSGLITGIANSGAAVVAVRPRQNFVGNPFPVAFTLDESELFTGNAVTGLRAGSIAAKADTVQVFTGETWETFYYQRNQQLGSGWRSIEDALTDAGSTEIPAGSAIMIRRKGGGFKWKLSSQVAAP